MEIHWVGYLWTLLAVFLACFILRATGTKGTI